MINIDALVAQESAVLDQMAKDKGGAWLARHVANRTAKYLAQELRKELTRLGCDEFTADTASRIVEAYR